MIQAAYRLGPVHAAVECGEAVAAYLDGFYDRADDVPEDAWRFRCGDGPAPGIPVQRTPFGVGVQVDAERRAVHLHAASASGEDLRITARKLIRAIFIRHCEERGFTLLHASAFHGDGALIILAGDRGAGKTTLALDAVLRHGFTLLSNDHLVLHREGPRLVLTSVPTFVSVKVGTARALADVLPPHPELRAADLAALGAPGTAALRKNRSAVYYSFGELGQPCLGRVELGPGAPPRRTWIVFPRFGATAAAPVPLQGAGRAAAALRGFVREDWVYDEDDAPTYFAAPRRTPAEFAADSRALCRALVEGATTLRWRHGGEVAPLLDAVRAGAAEGAR
jgi:hypothetical protein